MPPHFKKAIVTLVAVVFIILGIAGLALPFLQGFLFLAIGIVLLSLVSQRVRVWTEVHTRRFQPLHKLVERMEAWVSRIIGPL